MVQGRNSSASRLVGSSDPLLTCRYNGPQPPDGDHVYTLRVFALDVMPDLREGFWANELVHAMHGHVIEWAEANLPARA
jgi:Raf kinase inhibitor-like YbhB/YbcL family protein